jgi:hypothetical protein
MTHITTQGERKAFHLGNGLDHVFKDLEDQAILVGSSALDVAIGMKSKDESKKTAAGHYPMAKASAMPKGRY